MIRQLLNLFEEYNKQFPIDGNMRHNITLNPETKTLELGVWIGKECAVFNLDEDLLTHPLSSLAPTRKDGERILPPGERQSEPGELPVKE